MRISSNLPNKADFQGFFIPGLMGLLMGLVVACGDDPTATPISPTTTVTTSAPAQNPTSTTAAPTTAPTSTTKPTPTTVPFRVTVIDSNDNEVVFDEPPQRVVSYSSGPVEILFAMGEGQRIVAIHDFLTYPPEAVEITRIGSAFAINLEKIVELEPDLIYTFFGSSVPDLESTGVPVLYLKTPNSLKGIVDEMRMWGLITDNEEAADQLAETFEQKIAELETLVEEVSEQPSLFHDGTDFFTSGPNTLVGQVYNLLKVYNIAFDTPDGSYGQLSAEIVVERDPEIIITPFLFRLQEILDDPALQGVAALENNRVYAIDGDLVEVAGPRYVQAIEQLATLIYPDLFE